MAQVSDKKVGGCAVDYSQSEEALGTGELALKKPVSLDLQDTHFSHNDPGNEGMRRRKPSLSGHWSHWLTEGA